jgi:lysozyme
VSRFDTSLLARALDWAKNGPPAPAAAPAGPQLDPIAIAAALCRRFEGLRLRPYLCPAGVPSIGYGSTVYEDGRRVRLTDAPISVARAEALLQWHLRSVVMPAVQKLCADVSGAGQLAVLLDFTFNLGAGRLAGSTLRRRVNAGDWAAVPAELRKWVRGGGRVLAGLVARREAEALLI